MLNVIIIHFKHSKKPVGEERIAPGVLQSNDQANRKLNWVLKNDVIWNYLSTLYS